jgi:tetratricopeptide (TPR) repeat protein/predicted Ser/Thr protein kinase
VKHPERVGKYEIIRVLGQGGMGTVYEARDSVINRQVAVKMMLQGLAESPDLRERFMREAQAAGGLRHRNIVTVYDFGEDAENRPYIAMEFIEGTDLERVIQNREPHPVSWKVDVILQICEGLAFAHRAGIVHRDVKPANIRVSPDGEVKIMDFGIARLQSSNLTKSGLVLGSAHYMAPEQINGLRADHRSDLFSVGAIAFELLAGRKPFEADSLTAVLFKVTHERPPAELLPKSEYSPGLEQVILKALATSPDDRYQTLDAMHEDLERVVREAAKNEPPADPVEALRRRVEHEMAERRAEIARARAEGQLQKALALCQKLLELEPDDAAIQREAKEIEAAIQDREVEQMVAVAEGYLEQGDRALAEKIAARAAKLAPDSPRALALRARLAAAAEDQGAADTLLEAAREHLVHGNLQEARAAAEEALSADPGNGAAREILERVSKVLAVREQAAPPVVEPAPVPVVAPAAPAPPAASVAPVVEPEAAPPATREEVFFDESGPASAPTPIPVAPEPVAAEPEPPVAVASAPPVPVPAPVASAPEPVAAPAISAPPTAPPPPVAVAPPTAVPAPTVPASPAPVPPVLASPPPVAPTSTQAPAPPTPSPAAAAPAAAPAMAERKAEAAALATAAMNHFVANNNAKARRAAERALELDPANKKAKDLLKILALG